MTDLEVHMGVFSKVFGAFIVYFNFVLIACIIASIRTKSNRFYSLFNLGFPLDSFNKVEKAIIIVGAVLAAGHLINSFLLL